MNHYKTTITGLILGGLMAAEPIVTNGEFTIKTDWLKLAFAVGTFILGVFAHDPKKSA